MASAMARGLVISSDVSYVLCKFYLAVTDISEGLLSWTKAGRG